MTAPSIVLFSGAGGGAPDLTIFAGQSGNTNRVRVINYPGWQRYVAPEFSAETLVDELAAQASVAVPHGPIYIVGISIGGHFGYAVALRLQSIGREVGGFCAIDSFMIESAAASPGWLKRVLAHGAELLRKRRMREFAHFSRSLFWRALFRFAGGRLQSLLRNRAPAARLATGTTAEPMFEHELNMRLLIRAAAPWIASLDRATVPLGVPAVLVRTRQTAQDDQAWRHRCPQIQILEVPGEHRTLFEPKNAAPLREAYAAGTRDWQTGG